MSFTRKELDELKALSKATFGTTSFWQNKIYNRYPLYTFDEIKAHIIKSKEDAEAFLSKNSPLKPDDTSK